MLRSISAQFVQISIEMACFFVQVPITRMTVQQRNTYQFILLLVAYLV